MTESLFPQLGAGDVSYVKLRELESRLLAATRAGKVAWEKGSREFTWAARKGVVDVSPAGITVWDDSGVRHRQFHPGTNELYDAVVAWHDAWVTDTLDRILAELSVTA